MLRHPLALCFSATLLSCLFLASPCAVKAQTGNPLNLVPGVSATVVLGSIQNLSAFDTSTGSADIDYNNSDLATRNYAIRLPSGFNPNAPAGTYGLIAWNDSGEPSGPPSSHTATLDANNLIWLSGYGIGNGQYTSLRTGVTVMGTFRLMELYPLNQERIFLSGLSGGSNSNATLAYLRNDVFKGFISRVGNQLPSRIPGWQTYGRSTAPDDADYEWSYLYSGVSSPRMPRYFRTVICTQNGDFRRSELAGIYRYGHLNYGNTVRFLSRPGGHSDEAPLNFADALDFINHPLRDVVWDRFEDGSLASNVLSGKTVAGSGFSSVLGQVSEGSYTYNGNNPGVMTLTGESAAVSNDAFAWQDKYGILVDARLRAETALGLNQEIGLHIIPQGSSASSAINQPGFHLIWGYNGNPHRAEVVSATGVRKVLATWQHTATHPMNLPTTVTSTQSGEGVVQEKTFWGDADHAGQTLKFRGEDIRLALNSTGFQITFNRPAVNLTTSYAGVVTAAFDNTFPTNALPQAPNENFPIVVQGFWAEVETSLINALPSGQWKVALSNRPFQSGQPMGNALVDEIRLVGTSTTPAIPATLSATATSSGIALTWEESLGALQYEIQRSTSPDGPFTTLATLPFHKIRHTDSTATAQTAYYYRVAALGESGASRGFSGVSFAVPLFSVPNFGFETPALTSGNRYSYNTSGASWAFHALFTNAGSGMSANGTALTSSNNSAPQGTQVAFCQGLGAMAQNIGGLAFPATYQVTYAAAVRQNGTGALLQNWEIQRDGVGVSSVTTTGTLASNKPYIDRSFTLQTTASTHQIRFVGTVNNTKATVFFDNIRMTLLPPGAPTGLSASFPAASQCHLQWTDATTSETGYRVERSLAGKAAWTVIATGLPAGTTSFTDTTAAASLSYDYRVTAYGAGGLSTAASLTVTLPDAAPAAPANLSASATFNSVTLSWSASVNAVSYSIYRSASVNGSYSLLASGVAGNSYVHSGLVPQSTGHYRIRAVNGALESGDSSTVSATVLAIPVPQNVTVTPGFTTNTVAWSAVEGMDSYTVERSDGGAFAAVASGLTQASWTDTGRVTGVSYSYRVISVYGAFSSAASASIAGTPFAGTATRLNNASLLDSGSAWSSGVLPTSGDKAEWTGTYSSGLSGIGSGLSVDGLIISQPSTAITLSGDTGQLTVGASGIDLSAASQNLTVESGLHLAASQVWNVQSGRTLTVSGPVSATANTWSATKSGAGTAVLSSAASSWSGTLAVNAGVVQLGSGGALASVPFSLDIASGARVNVHSSGTTLLSQGLQGAGVLSANLNGSTVVVDQPAGNRSLYELTGVSGGVLVLDGESTSYTTVSRPINTSGVTARVTGGNWIVNGDGGYSSALEVSGGRFERPAATGNFYNLSSVSVTGGELISANNYGMRMGSTFGAANNSGSLFSGLQTGGLIQVSGSDAELGSSTPNINATFTLSGGVFHCSNGRGLRLGAATTGTGVTRFTLSNSGKLICSGTVQGTQATTAAQVFDMTGGTLAVATFNATNLRDSAGGSNGTLRVKGGKVAPGDTLSAGRMSITGAWVLESAATLEIDLGGTAQAASFQATGYDYVTGGTATLNGALALRLINGFTPSNATVFTVVNASSLSGAFSNVASGQRLTTVGGEGSFVVTRSGNTVQLSQYLNAFDTWKLANLGTSSNTGNAADSADPDGDSVPNLLEYALAADPMKASPAPVENVPAAVVPTVRFERVSDPALIYTVQATDSLKTPDWQTIWTSSGAENQSGTVEVPDLTPFQGTRFLRIVVGR